MFLRPKKIFNEITSTLLLVIVNPDLKPRLAYFIESQHIIGLITNSIELKTCLR